MGEDTHSNERAGYELKLDKSNTEPPKTNYLNTAFAEHEKLFDAISPDVPVRIYERKVRHYLSLIKDQHRKPILERIAKNTLTHLKAYEEGDEDAQGKKTPRKADPGDKDYLRALALEDAVGEGMDYFSKYHNADGNELAVFAFGMWGYDINGKPYCLMKPELAYQYMSQMAEKLADQKKLPKNKIVKVETPFDL